MVADQLALWKAAAVLSSILLGAASVALAQPRFPDDVMRFIEQRDACDHFRGEEPYDAERRKFLAQQMRQLCAGTDAQLARLKEKYRGDTAVTTRLADYESQIEAGPQR